MDQRYNTLRFWCATAAGLVSAACLVTAIASWRSLNDRLQQAADSAIFSAEYLVTKSALDLEKLDALRFAECDEKTIATLKDTVYNALLPMREIGVIRKGRLFCSNFGPVTLNASPDTVRLVPGTQISFGPNLVVPGNRSLFVYRVTEKDSAINGVINAPILGEFERGGFEFAAFGQQRLLFASPDANASTVAAAARDPIYEIGQVKLNLRDSFWRARAVSEIYPFEAEVVVTSAAYWSQWWSVFPGMLFSFALIGALVGVLATWWIKRGGPSRLRYNRALSRGEFVVHYQPIVDAQSHAVVGVEALLRWRHPTAGLLRACEFASLFDQTELMLPLTEYVLKSVERDMPALVGGEHIWCSINVPTQVFEGSQLSNLLGAFAGRKHPWGLRLEITERAPLSAASEHTVSEIRSLGIAIGMDDIGTGHSNLDQLQRLTYDFVKIDGMLVRGIFSVDSVSPVVQSLIALAKKINTVVIAEGVENEIQAEALSRAGVQQLQGYLYGRAVPIVDIAEALSVASRSSALR